MSALIGSPPNTDADRQIIRGFLIMGYLPVNSANVEKGLEIGAPKPAGYVYRSQSRVGVNLAQWSIALAVIVIITVLRLILRARHRTMRWGWDDVLIIPAALFAIAYLIANILIVAVGGAGFHIWDVTYIEFSNFFLYSHISQLFFFLAVVFADFSIVAFQMRLTKMASKKWLIVHYTFLGVLALFLFGSIFTAISCLPPIVGFGLNNRAKHVQAKCINGLTSGTGMSVGHILVNAGLFIVTVSVLAGTQVNWKLKVRLCLLFSVGLVACIGSIMRLIVINQKNADLTWSYEPVGQWTVLDCTTSVIVGSLPALNPIYERIIPKAWRTTTTSRQTPETAKKTESTDEERRRRQIWPLRPFRHDPYRLTGLSTIASARTANETSDDHHDDLSDEEKKNHEIAVQKSFAISEEKSSDISEPEQNESRLHTDSNV